MSGGASLVRLAVLLSGEGTSLENLFECIERGELPARIEVVVSSKTGAGGLARARRRGVPAFAVPRKGHPDPKGHNDAVHDVLARFDVDLVLLLGYLSPFETRGRFDRRTLNVHPALIPKFSGRGFYGRRGHEAVIAAGEKTSGATVHWVDEQYDHGPIVFQEEVAVRPDDTPETLAARVQALERELVPRAIRRFADGTLCPEPAAGSRDASNPSTPNEPSHSAGREPGG